MKQIIRFFDILKINTFNNNNFTILEIDITYRSY